jgi:DNA-binding NarL/FixJ family response regulator
VVASPLGILRQSLARLLRPEDGFEVVGLAGTREEVLRLTEVERPDVVLLDARLQPEALQELLSALERAWPSLKALLLAGSGASRDSAEAVLLGAWGSVAGDAGVEQLRKAIRTVATGEHWIGHDALAEIVERLRGTRTSADAALDRVAHLTPREREIARGVAGGESNRELATRLGLTQATVKSHLSRVYEKLKISNRAQLATVVVRQPFDFDTATPSADTDRH